MISKAQFLKIHECKNSNFTRNQTVKYLGLHSGTVAKYWEMKESEYDQMLESKRANRGRGMKASKYSEEIQNLLRENPDRSTAEIIGFLKETHKPEDLGVCDRTIYTHTNWIRKQIRQGELAPAQ